MLGWGRGGGLGICRDIQGCVGMHMVEYVYVGMCKYLRGSDFEIRRDVHGFAGICRGVCVRTVVCVCMRVYVYEGLWVCRDASGCVGMFQDLKVCVIMCGDVWGGVGGCVGVCVCICRDACGSVGQCGMCRYVYVRVCICVIASGRMGCVCRDAP